MKWVTNIVQNREKRYKTLQINFFLLKKKVAFCRYADIYFEVGFNDSLDFLYAK